MLVIPTKEIDTDRETERSALDRSMLTTVFVAAALGIVIFYGVAFANSPLVHNAAHDVRHVAMMPCH